MTPSESCDVCKTPATADQLVAIGGKNVCARCKPDVLMNLKSGVQATPRIDPRVADEIKRRISRFNLLSFAIAIPGMVMQGLAAGIGNPAQTPDRPQPLVLVIQLLGAMLVIVGLSFYAHMKGRRGVLGLLGLLSCLGLIILHYLPKCCQNCRASASYRGKECGECGAPV